MPCPPRLPPAPFRQTRSPHQRSSTCTSSTAPPHAARPTLRRVASSSSCRLNAVSAPNSVIRFYARSRQNEKSHTYGEDDDFACDCGPWTASRVMPRIYPCSAHVPSATRTLSTRRRWLSREAMSPKRPARHGRGPANLGSTLRPKTRTARGFLGLNGGGPPLAYPSFSRSVSSAPRTVLTSVRQRFREVSRLR